MTEQELKQFQEDVAAILKRDYFPESEGYSIHTQLVRNMVSLLAFLIVALHLTSMWMIML